MISRRRHFVFGLYPWIFWPRSAPWDPVVPTLLTPGARIVPQKEQTSPEPLGVIWDNFFLFLWSATLRIWRNNFLCPLPKKNFMPSAQSRYFGAGPATPAKTRFWPVVLLLCSIQIIYSSKTTMLFIESAKKCEKQLKNNNFDPLQLCSRINKIELGLAVPVGWTTARI